MKKTLTKTETGIGLLALLWSVFLVGAFVGTWPWAIDFPLIAWNTVIICLILEGLPAVIWFAICALACLIYSAQSLTWKGGPVISAAFLFEAALFSTGSFLHARKLGRNARRVSISQ
ncbi:MAG: hypothetical protein ACAH95_06065 [Fimbriimonas sp.]